MMQTPAGFVADTAPTLPDGFVADTPTPDFRTANEKTPTGEAAIDLSESPLVRAATQFYEKSPLGPAAAAVNGAANVVAHPIDTLFGLVPVAETAKGLAKAQWDEAVKAAQKVKDAYQSGDKLSAVEALGHGLAAILPLLGPAAANVGEHGAAGDLAGMAGGAAGLLLPFAAKYGLELKNAHDATTAPRLEKEAAQTVSERVLAPGNPRYKPTARAIAPEVLKRGLSGDRMALQDIAEQGMNDAGQAIDAAQTAQGGGQSAVPTAPIVHALTQRIADYQINGKTIPTAAGQVEHLTALRDYIKDLGPTAPLDDVLKMRDEFYDTAAKAGGYAKAGGDASLGDVAWAAREGGSAIRQHLAAMNPDAAAARADYAFWKSLNDVLDPNLGRPKSAAAPSGVTGGRATVGAVAGAALATTPLGRAAAAVGLGKVVPAIVDLTNSPAWQLAKANQKYSLATAIRSGNLSKVSRAMANIAELAPRGVPMMALPAAAQQQEAQP